jgi:hypothetical protein
MRRLAILFSFIAVLSGVQQLFMPGNVTRIVETSTRVSGRVRAGVVCLRGLIYFLPRLRVLLGSLFPGSKMLAN